MRLWSIHPKYLDRMGLLALWREGLLAQKALQNKTKGYKNHPQLERFKASSKPLSALSSYLWGIYLEAKQRGYNFDSSKIPLGRVKKKLKVTDGQTRCELDHLKLKLKKRDTKAYRSLMKIKNPRVHPIFSVVKGDIEPWEVRKNSRTTR